MAKCDDCKWAIAHPNKQRGCLLAQGFIEIEKIKTVLAHEECGDYAIDSPTYIGCGGVSK